MKMIFENIDTLCVHVYVITHIQSSHNIEFVVYNKCIWHIYYLFYYSILSTQVFVQEP